MQELDDYISDHAYEFVNYHQNRRFQNMDGHAPRTMLYPNTGRNDLCPCGSGKKFKWCCINVEAEDAKT